eukprot:6938-Heterococcus_DN1.PRE.1
MCTNAVASTLVRVPVAVETSACCRVSVTVRVPTACYVFKAAAITAAAAAVAATTASIHSKYMQALLASAVKDNVPFGKLMPTASSTNAIQTYRSASRTSPRQDKATLSFKHLVSITCLISLASKTKKPDIAADACSDEALMVAQLRGSGSMLLESTSSHIKTLGYKRASPAQHQTCTAGKCKPKTTVTAKVLEGQMKHGGANGSNYVHSQNPAAYRCSNDYLDSHN